MRLIFLFLLLSLSLLSFSQSEYKKVLIKNEDGSTKSINYYKNDDIVCNAAFDTVEKRAIYFVTDKMPSFPGGEKALFTYIENNLKYPIAIEGSIQGKVFMRFIVEIDGEISNITILRGVDPLLDKLDIDLIKQMPDWIPGQCGETKVPAYFTIPIFFQLK